MTSEDNVVERAIALTSRGEGNPGQPGSPGRGDPMEELVRAGRAALEDARTRLVQRLYLRSDDYEATAALSLVNKALAALGWEDAYNWKHRRKP
jgi:hypothetical protein